MRVIWDESKNLANQRKHGVSFEEAEELFASGGDHLEIFDQAHSDLEDRFIAIGPITRGLVLVVWTDMMRTRSGSSTLAGLANTSRFSTVPTWTNAND